MLEDGCVRNLLERHFDIRCSMFGVHLFATLQKKPFPPQCKIVTIPLYVCFI